MIYFACQAAGHALSYGAAPLVGLVLLATNLFISTLVHEFGHALAAVAVGHRVHLIMVWRLTYQPRVGRFIGAPEHLRKKFAGCVVHAPRGLHGASRVELAWIAASGALANLSLACLCAIVAAYLARNEVSWFLPHWSAAAEALGVTSGIVGLASLLPSVASHNDGRHFVELLYKPARSPGEWRYATIQALSIDGTQPETWDRDLIRALEDDVLPPEMAAGRDIYVATYYLRAGDVTSLKRFLEKSLAVKDGSSPELVADYAFALALVDGDGAGALAQLDRVAEQDQGFSFWRSKATALAVLGRGAEARLAASTARAIHTGDQDDAALFDAIERNLPLPVTFPRPQPVPA